ncbi:MAG: hypothetical protein HOP18_11840, partial [Deltaproteobacteria bacterium]|nr:hypothetical protein [Deltaproteobacteria bacterium]
MQDRGNVWSQRGKNIARTLLGMSIALTLVSTAVAQDTPMGAKWWPSEWGPEDQRGAANRITPQKILQAV